MISTVSVTDTERQSCWVKISASRWNNFSDTPIAVAVQCWDMNLSQSISSICGGHITSPHHDDYIVHTFGGALVVFSNGTGKAPKPSPAAAAANAAAEQAADALQAVESALAEKKAAVAGVEKELAALNAELAVRFIVLRACAPKDLQLCYVSGTEC